MQDYKKALDEEFSRKNLPQYGERMFAVDFRPIDGNHYAGFITYPNSQGTTLNITEASEDTVKVLLMGLSKSSLRPDAGDRITNEEMGANTDAYYSMLWHLRKTARELRSALTTTDDAGLTTEHGVSAQVPSGPYLAFSCKSPAQNDRENPSIYFVPVLSPK